MSGQVSLANDSGQPVYFSFGTVSSAGVWTLSTTTNQASNAMYKENPLTTFQTILTGTSGTYTGTVQIQVTNETTPTNWLNYGPSMAMSGTTTQTAGFPLTNATTEGIIGAWRWVRANVTNVTGTGAAVVVIMGA